MPSPAKKRKRNAEPEKSVHPRGLEYFFSKQRENVSASQTAAAVSDEELARTLQAEWDEEERERQRERELEREPEREPEPEQLKEKQRQQASEPVPNTLSLQPVATAEDQMAATLPLDESPLTFDPQAHLPGLQRQWAAENGGRASYALLIRCFVLVSATQSRIKIVDTLANTLRLLIEGDPASLLPAVWLTTNAIRPPFCVDGGGELGLGYAALAKALKAACGLDSRGLKALFDQHGDAGDVAYAAKKRQAFSLRRPQPLTIAGVYAALVRVAASQGAGSVEAKQRIVDRLLQDARGGDESRFLVRTLCQHLRIGAVKTTMLIALSRAFLLSKPPGAAFATRGPLALAALQKDERAAVYARAEETVKACFAQRPSYDDLVPALLDLGVADDDDDHALLRSRCGLALHTPLRPMLGAITRDLGEMLARLQGRAFACEFKYDGQRAQVHCDADGRVSLFSRHLEAMTDKYPDLVALAPQIRGDGVSSFVLEGEVVAVDRAAVRDDGGGPPRLLSFQTLTGRARKDVALGSVRIDVCLFAFDLMYLNGQPLLDRPFRERRALLRSLFVEVPHRFTWVQSLDATSDDGDAISAFFQSATAAKCEGIMVKVLDNEAVAQADKPEGEAATGDGKEKDKLKGEQPDEPELKKSRRKPLLATYEPDKRLDSWLKVKKDYGAASDTLDLIPIAAWHGSGRKAKWWSPILMAVRNEETGSLEAVTKCISGFTDAFYKENRAFYDTDKNTHPRQPSYVDYTGPEPDVWFEPQEVWEMAFADITLSPTYTAAIGLVSDARGLSLRFPRFLRKRDDKSLDEATTSASLAALYRKQAAPPQD